MDDRHGSHRLQADADIDRAWAFAIEHQGEQDRKVGGGPDVRVPYTSHLKGVALRVQLDGGTVQEIIGGMLHDIVEDTPVNGGRSIEVDEVRDAFGDRVARIVETCTDTSHEPGAPKEPWRMRKERHFARISGADPGILRVVAADKADNITGQVESLEACNGDPAARAEALAPFKGGFAGTLWYDRGMHAAMGDTLAGSALYAELTGLIERFAALRAFSAQEIARRDRVLSVLGSSDPSRVGIGRVSDGYYRIDADELARCCGVSGADGAEDVVGDHIRKWYCPSHADAAGHGPDAERCTAVGWDAAVVERTAAALR
jgi:hypothetical protein